MDVTIEDPQSYREYWLYKAKLAVLCDRFQEAVEFCSSAVARERQNTGDKKDFKVFVRAIDGRAKELRFRLHQVDAFRRDRSVSTAEAFGPKAETLFENVRDDLFDACSEGLAIVHKLLAGDYAENSEGHRALKRLEGDLLRYKGDDGMAMRAYEEATQGEKVNNAAYNYATLGASILTPKDRRAGMKIPGVSRPIKHCEIPLVPIKLNMVRDLQEEARVSLPFKETDWQPFEPAPLA